MEHLGLVGLADSGHARLFAALTGIDASTSAERVLGVVQLPDDRLDRLAAMSESKNVVPAVFEIAYLPGLSTVNGTCTTCHDTPNVGNHSVALAINIGVTDYPARGGLDISGLPVYTIKCNSTGATVQTTDPGRALVTGKCADVGKTKGPILRALPARAPYFHNGSAATLREAIEFYDQRFNLNMTDRQKADLVAFLQTL